MTDIEKIKAEIERLRMKLPWGSSASQISMECNCKSEAYDEILSFIEESLQKKPKGPKTTFYMPNYNLEGIVDNSGWHFGRQNSLEKEPDLDLGKVLSGWMGHYAYENGGEYPSTIDIARHFYELGKNSK